MTLAATCSDAARPGHRLHFLQNPQRLVPTPVKEVWGVMTERGMWEKRTGDLKALSPFLPKLTMYILTTQDQNTNHFLGLLSGQGHCVYKLPS